MKKFLIIRFSSIGDIVLTTPVIRCVKKQLPGVQLHFLTKASFADVVSANPYIDKVWIYGENHEALIQALREEKFDFIIDLHHNLRSLRVRRMLGVKGNAFKKLNVEKWLMVNFKINFLPDVHIVNRYLDTVASLGVKYDGHGLDYFIPHSDEVNPENLPLPWRKGYVGFVIGAKHATKRLPVAKIVSIINDMQLPVILLGGPEDKAIASEIITQTGELVFNACGNFKLAQSASLVKQARLIITHDTGLMHIAAAFNQHIISVWGNTIPGFGMTPFLSGGNSVIVENNHLSCRPCSKIGYEKCPRSHFRCMWDIDTDIIVKHAMEWWAQIPVTKQH